MCVFWVNGGENEARKKERKKEEAKFYLDFARNRRTSVTVRCQMSNTVLAQTVLFLEKIISTLEKNTGKNWQLRSI